MTAHWSTVYVREITLTIYVRSIFKLSVHRFPCNILWNRYELNKHIYTREIILWVLTAKRTCASLKINKEFFLTYPFSYVSSIVIPLTLLLLRLLILILPLLLLLLIIMIIIFTQLERKSYRRYQQNPPSKYIGNCSRSNSL